MLQLSFETLFSVPRFHSYTPSRAIIALLGWCSSAAPSLRVPDSGTCPGRRPNRGSLSVKTPGLDTLLDYDPAAMTKSLEQA